MENRAGQTESVNLVKVNVYCCYMVEDYMPKDPILRFVNETNPDIQEKLEKMTQQYHLRPSYSRLRNQR